MRGAARNPTAPGHPSRGRRSEPGPRTPPPGRRPSDRTLRSAVAALLTMALVSMQLLAAPVEAGERYALVVGVENYIPDELPSLEYAEDDATALSAALADLGFSVITMTAQAKNPLQRPTSATQILDQVTDRLRERAASDTVVLAFSGHGVQFRGEKETYFCPEQATLSKRDSLVPMSTVMALIGRSAAKRKLLLVDACRDELEPPIAAKGGIVVQLEAAGVFRPEPAKGTVVLFSCAEQEKSYESRALGHTNSDRHPHAVAALAPSRLGIYDLLGNVGEWCQDRQPSDDDGRPLRMVRGGSWFDDAADCTAERVFWMDEDGRRNTCGLRVVLSPVGGTALAP